VVLHQHEAAQFRTEMAVDPLRQWGQDCPPLRRYPAFSQRTDCLRRNHQILDQKRFMTFENRSQRDLDPDDLFLDLDQRRDLASTRLLPRSGAVSELASWDHLLRFSLTWMPAACRIRCTVIGRTFASQFGER
jgi:hypothetical protein